MFQLSNILVLFIAINSNGFILSPSRWSMKPLFQERPSPLRQPREASSTDASRQNQSPQEQKVWQSGKIFNRPTGNQRREKGGSSHAWWMKEEEENNPRMLPKYKPSWMGSSLVDSTWKLVDLKAEAQRRGLKVTGKKDELIARINASNPNNLAKELLSDDKFTASRYIEVENNDRPSCYPEVYEGTGEIARLKEMFMTMPPTA